MEQRTPSMSGRSREGPISLKHKLECEDFGHDENENPETLFASISHFAKSDQRYYDLCDPCWQLWKNIEDVEGADF